MKTSGIKALMREILESMPRPYSEHVIDEVFAAIESEPRWFRDYEALCSDLGKTVVHTWGGYWIANLVGKAGGVSTLVLVEGESDAEAVRALAGHAQDSLCAKPR